jgi:hypothetical protein
MDIEPVTGNEVPPGSMAKEVRDDVPAMLSEGEYVVPADVVRYYGVKFFEDLRSEAKSDMVDMEENGRIGGEAVDSNGIPMDDSEELTPEEMAMLEEALAADSGMAMGGLATNQQPPQDPYQQQQTMYTQQYAGGGVVKGYAPGGDITKPTFTYGGGQPYPMGNPYGGGAYSSTGGFEARTYVNETTGQTRTFQFLNGQPISYIPPGFVPMGQAETTKATADNLTSTTTTTTTPVEEREAAGGYEPDDPAFSQGKYGRDYSEMTDDELEAAQKSLNQAKTLSAVMPLGPVSLLAAIGIKTEQSKLNKAKEMSLESRMEDRYEGKLTETTKEGVMVFSPTDKTTRPQPNPFYSTQPTQPTPPAPVPDITQTTLGPTFSATPTPPSDTTTAPTGLKGTAEAPSGTKSEPVMGYTSGNVAPTPTAPQEVSYTGFPTQDLGIPTPGTPVGIPSLDEAIFGIDTPQTGGLFKGKDVSQAVVDQVAQQAAISRQANLEAQVPVSVFGPTTNNLGPVDYSNPPANSANLTGIMGFGTNQSAPNATPGVDVSPSINAPSISGAMSAAVQGFGTSKGGEFAGTATDTSVNNAYSGLANSVGPAPTNNAPSGNFGGGNGSISGAQSAASMGFGSNRGGEFGGISTSPSVSAPASSSTAGAQVSYSSGTTPSRSGVATMNDSVSAVDTNDPRGGSAASRGGDGGRSGMSPSEAASTPSAQAAARGGIEAGIAARGGGGDGGGGGKVICTALHNKGLLDSRIYELDEAYGQIVRATNPDLMIGYHKLAKPFAAYIQKDTPLAITARYAVAPFARAWAQEMAHTMRPDEFKGSLLGKAIMAITYPVCEWVGKKEQETVYGRV